VAETLTAQQKMAVENRGGNLLVSAAAGSGKTKVLVDRLMSYLTDPVKPENIDSFLMITYTKAAASELRGKIASKLSKAIADSPENRHLRRQMQRLYLTKISTVHSFCADILKEYAYMLDIPADFRVADENECVQLQAAALERVLNDAYEKEIPDEDFIIFLDSQGLGRDDRLVPQLVLSVYRKAKCHLDSNKWLDQCLESCKLRTTTDLGETPWGQYLITDLKKYVHLQIDAIRKCLDLARAAGNMEKPAALLEDTVSQLERICCYETWDEIYIHRDINYGTLTFSKKCTDTGLIEQIKAVRDACKEGIKKRLRRFSGDSRQLLEDMQSTEAATRGLVDLVRKFEHEYTRLKRGRHILDFTDLEHYALDLLWGRSRSGITAIAREIGNRYCQIMVDEYQDSNAVQDAIFRALSVHRNNCFMVGDVKQSIYQFRLADPSIFLDKYSRYVSASDAEDGVGRKVLLSSNFRSGGAVIEAVNDVFYDCMYAPVGGLRYTDAEALSEGISHIQLPDAAVELHAICVDSDTYAEESAFVANRIEQLLSGGTLIREGEQLRPIRPEDIVILLRSPGSVGRQFQMALEDIGISCSFDNGTDLLEAEEVQFVHSLLQTISNPLQDIPLIATLSSRVFGFTADMLAEIRSNDLKSQFYTALAKDQNAKSKEFLAILDRLRLDARMVSITQLIDNILVITDADAIYRSMPDGQSRMQNLQGLYSLAISYSSVGNGSLEGFLDYLQIISNEGYQIQSAAAPDSVKIMSIHKSKGLEFPVVFLCGLSKSFNMEQTREQVLCDSELGLGLNCVDVQRRLRYPTVAKLAISAKMRTEALSEELRVLYVAMTRPKDRLIMTYASGNLEKEIAELAAKMDICEPLLLSSEVGSAGEWVLISALRHSEAACLHKFARKPDSVRIMKYPWKICIAEHPANSEALSFVCDEVSRISNGNIERIMDGLAVKYPYTASTQVPSKLTATQLKGRYKDHEAAEGTPQNHFFKFRKPEFVQAQVSGSRYGTAMHTIMQHLQFSACNDIQQLELQLQRLVDEGHITAQLAQNVDLYDILRFFQTDVGRRLQAGTNCIREFKFSILDDACRYVPNTEGEKILLQGVVDCALIEDCGITVVDFKTDHVNLDTLQNSVDRYRSQVQTYAYALGKIYGRPVLNAYLYYFRIGKLVSVEL
jgi:ATP-dependent helicase/nuclease subunit A